MLTKRGGRLAFDGIIARASSRMAEAAKRFSLREQAPKKTAMPFQAMTVIESFPKRLTLIHCDCRRTGFTCANADRFFDAGEENLTISDLAGIGAFDDRLSDAFGLLVVDNDFDFNLGKEIHSVF